MTAWHDLNQAPLRPSRVLGQWKTGPQAVRAAAVQRDRLQQQSRAYAGAESNRLTGDWTALSTSADSETLTSLRVLRARSRQLVRDNPYAKHAVRVITNNVVGAGIGMQAQVVNARGKLQAPVNDSIEQAWADWSDKESCHTAGLLGFADLERYGMHQLVTSGEFIVRKIRQPFGRRNQVPLALEVIESDRLLDVWQTARAPNGNAIRMGVEIDQWHRPVAYWFSPQHPGDYQFTTFEPARFMRVPAEDILHLYIVERWPQTRGEPWFHSIVRNLHDVGGYEEAVVVKARATANIVGFIRGPEPLVADGVQGGRQVIDTEPGTWQRLLPGEDVAGMNATVADPSVEPFLRYMLRKMAVGVGVSYESLSRDYSQSNYSSSRMALLDDRDLYRVLQGFVSRNLRQDVHREFLDSAALVGAVKVGADYYSNPAKYQAVRFKPRGWSWIDPAKEVLAYKTAVRNGFMTQGDVVNQTSSGVDIEDVLKQRRAELDLAAELELVFDSDPLQVNDKGQAQPLPVETEVEGGEAQDASTAASADASTNDASDGNNANDGSGDGAGNQG
jgi:lambda family phage portal protein